MSRPRPDSLRSFFEPKSIAVAGVSADPNKLGSIIFANMIENRRKGLLKAPVYALNPAHDRIGDQPCYRSIEMLPETPELLVVAVPEPLTVELVKKAARQGVNAAAIVTSGYAEVGRGDVERDIGRVASRHGMRILGPNTIGLVDTWSGVDSLFLQPTKSLPDGSQVVSMLKPLKGEIAIVTQSGHLGEVVSEELAARGVGVRALVGIGNQLDVSVEDVIEYFAADSHTKVIAVYLEGVRDGRRFVQAAADATREKPLVVFKVGKTGVGARAALTHTASLVGDYDAYRAAFRSAGVVEAVNLHELVDFPIILEMLPRASGKRLAIVTNAGGVGAIAADEAEKAGLAVEPLGIRAVRRLRSEFRGEGFISNAGLANPVDLTASVTTEDFVRVAESVLSLPQFDLGLLLPTQQAPTIDYDVAKRLERVVLRSRKPVAACVIGNSDLAYRIQREFIDIGIPSFPTPERAVRSLAALASYSKVGGRPRKPAVRARPALRFSRSRGPLPPHEVSRLLESYGIREPRSVVVHSYEDVDRVRKLGFPVVCKLLAERLLHKTDVGGVVMGVSSTADAARVFAGFRKVAVGNRIQFGGMLAQETVGKGVELILGGTRDPVFGPMVMVGLGGTYTELIRDYSLALAPVTPKEAEALLAQTRVARALEGYRGGPRVGVENLSRVVSAFSRMLVEQPLVEELEVNPLMVTKNEVLAVDARVLLRRR